MKNPKITFENDISIISTENMSLSPLEIYNIFDKLADMGINVDMISKTYNKGDVTSLSFTITDEDQEKIIKLGREIKENSNVKLSINGRNTKICIFDNQMDKEVGFAKKIFKIFLDNNTPIKMITTSDFDISIIIDENALEIKKAFEEIFDNIEII